MKDGMAVFIAEGGDAEEIECEEKALAPIYQHKTEHELPCRHAPMPSGIPFQQKPTKETPMAVKKFTPKGKAPVGGEDVASRLIRIFSTSGGTTAAQAMAQLDDLGVLAESSVEQFLAASPKGYTLQQRKGEGGAAVYRLAPEQPGAGPGGTQQEEEGQMATAAAVKKTVGKNKVGKAGKAGKASEKAPKVGKATNAKTRSAGFVKAVIAGLVKPLTKEALATELAKKFPERDVESIKRTLGSLLGWYLKQRKGIKVSSAKNEGVILYQITKLTKATS